MTQWNHLPVAGGLYDQHPKLLEEWQVIAEAKAKHEEREEKRRQDRMLNDRQSTPKRKGR
jgi:hypothetical protein